MNRIRVQTGLAIALLLGIGAAQAQFIGYTAPQSVQLTNTQLFGTATINAAATSSAVTNVGNTVHYLEYSCSLVFKLDVWFEASPTGVAGTYQKVSASSYNVNSGGLTAYLYLPFVRVKVNALQTAAGNCTFAYTGTSVAPAQLTGIFARLGSTILAYQSDTASATYTYTFQPNNGRSGGTLWFQFVDTGFTCPLTTLSLDAYPNGIPTGAATQIRLLPNNFSGGGGGGLSLPTGTTAAMAADIAAHPFWVPDIAATDMTVTVTRGAGCGGPNLALFNLWFSPLPNVNGAPAQGSTPSGTTNLGNPVKVGCAYNSAAPTVTTGQTVDLQCDANGGVIVSPVTIGGTMTVTSVGAYVASLVVKSSAGSLYGFIVYNSAAFDQFYMVFNATALPANGTSPATAPLLCPSLSTCSFTVGLLPMTFSTGMVLANSTTSPTLTTGAADSILQGFYK